MPTTVKTFSERFRGLEDAVDRAFRSVYNTDAGPTAEDPQVDAFFEENEAASNRAVSVKCSLLKGGTEEEPVYAIVPATQPLRRDASGTAKLKISTSGADKGNFINEAAFMERYTMVVPGILHVAGTAGAGADTAVLGGATVVVRPVVRSDGITHLSLDVGGLAGEADAEQVEIEAALQRLELQWLPVEGRPARPGGHKVQPHFTSMADDDGLARTTLAPAQLSGEDEMIQAALKAVGATPDGQAVQARSLAQFLVAVVGGDAEHVKAVTIGLAHAGSDPGGVAGRFAHATGDNLVKKLAAALSGMESGILQDIAAHDFGGGRTVASGAVPPNEIGAHVRSVILDILAQAAAAVTDKLEAPSPEAARATMGAGPLMGEQRNSRRAIDLTGAGTRVGERAGAFAGLVPNSAPDSTARQVVERLGGFSLCDTMRSVVGQRDAIAFFSGITDTTVKLAEADYSIIMQRATENGYSPNTDPPANWEAAREVLELVVTMATFKRHAQPGKADQNQTGQATTDKFYAPLGSTVTVKAATGASKDAAAVANVIAPLAVPSNILAEHAKATAISAMPEAERPSAATQMNELINSSSYGPAARGIILSNKTYSGDLPGKGEIAATPLTLRACMHAQITANIEKATGRVMAQRERAKIDEVAEACFTGSFTLERVVQVLGARQSTDDALDEPGVLGSTTGPTALADFERAMNRLGDIMKHLYCAALGGTESREGFGLAHLAQQSASLTDKLRVELFTHLFSAWAREFEEMRRSAQAPLIDLEAVVLATRTGKLTRLRQYHEAHEAGKEAALRVAGKTDTHNPAGTQLPGPNNARNREKRQRQKEQKTAMKAQTIGDGQSPGARTTSPPGATVQYTFAPGSLTRMLGRGEPTGAVEAFDSLDLSPKPCAWAALAKKGCTGKACRKCNAPGGSPPAPAWAVNKIIDAASANLREQFLVPRK
jgi:hypothetical protein